MHNSIGIISWEMFFLELSSQAHSFPLCSYVSKFYNGEHCNTYILLDVLLCSIAEYFYELCHILARP